MESNSVIVNPWEVKGNVDYNKLLDEFGLKRISPALMKRIEKNAGELHHYLRRGIVFAHRDLDKALDEYKKKNLFLYTGRGPSGPIHIGHISVWLFVKWLQEKLGLELWFQFTDDEKYLFNNLSMAEIDKWLHENMLDIIALGFDPKKTHFLIDTKHANLMYPEAIKVAKKITFSTVKAAFGFTNNFNVGEIFFTAMQAVPAFLPSIIRGKKMFCLIPHAIDQDPHFRVSRDAIHKLGFPKPGSIQSVFLPGLGGISKDGKMSSSTGQAIYLTDTPNEVKKKINKYAFSGGQNTIEEHRKKGGNPDIDVAYQWLTFFEEDDKKLKNIYDDYKSGKLLSGELKKILIDKLNLFLAAHQKRRKNAVKLLDKFIYKP